MASTGLLRFQQRLELCKHEKKIGAKFAGWQYGAMVPGGEEVLAWAARLAWDKKGIDFCPWACGCLGLILVLGLCCCGYRFSVFLGRVLCHLAIVFVKTIELGVCLLLLSADNFRLLL